MTIKYDLLANLDKTGSDSFVVIFRFYWKKCGEPSMNKGMYLEKERPKNRAKELWKIIYWYWLNLKFLRFLRYNLCVLIIAFSFFPFHTDNIFSKLLISINLFHFVSFYCSRFFFSDTKLAKTQIWTQRSNFNICLHLQTESKYLPGKKPVRRKHLKLLILLKKKKKISPCPP